MPSKVVSSAETRRPPAAGRGRKKGVPNKVTRDVRLAIKHLLEESADELVGWMARVAKTNPGRALDIYARLGDYVTPRLLRSEVSAAPSQFVVTNRHDYQQVSDAYQAMIHGGATVSFEDAGADPDPAEPPAATQELRSAESQPEADPLAQYRPRTPSAARSAEGDWP